MGQWSKGAPLALVLIAAPALAAPDTAGPPAVREKDAWAYVETYERPPGVWRQTHSELSVVHVMDDAIAISTHQVGDSATPQERMLGRDWSRFRSIGGKEVVVNRPVAFPLDVGKSWDLQYLDDAPSNHTHKTETITEHYRVVGLEDVDVPAGHFHAYKIEVNGHWTAEVATGATAVAVAHADARGSSTETAAVRPMHGAVEGRLYKAFWYVPEVRRWVKSVEEYYDANGNRNERFTAELESWRPAP
jgi:hypothetical protein